MKGKKNVVLIAVVLLSLVIFSGCIGEPDPGPGERVCWKCNGVFAEWEIFPDTVTCGEGLAVDYPYINEPTCYNPPPTNQDLTKYAEYPSPSSLTITQSKVSFSGLTGDETATIRTSIPGTLDFDLTFKYVINRLDQASCDGCGGHYLGVAFTNDPAILDMGLLDGTDAIVFMLKTYRHQTTSVPYILPLVRDYSQEWSSGNAYIEQYGRTDPEYFGTIAEVRLYREGDSLNIELVENGALTWVGSLLIDGTTTYDYFYAFMNCGTRSSTYEAIGEFYDFAFS